MRVEDVEIYDPQPQHPSAVQRDPLSTNMARLLLLAAVFCGLAAPLHAQPAAERLIAPIPPTFKLAGEPAHNGAKIQVFLPANETIDNWSEQIATTIYVNKGQADPAAVLRSIEKTWIAACKDSDPITILPGKTNGYMTATMLMQCPKFANTGKPEAGFVHAIAGNDHFYLVQKSAHTVFDRDRIKEMIRYMGTVTVCDGRTPDHPCPKSQ
jgi:hypothetical protein